VLVDRAWRTASQNPRLYAYQLSRCPSYSLKTSTVDIGLSTDDTLPQLKRRFAQEVKRNLFEAYLRPQRTVVSLLSTTASASAAFPGGEALTFCFSPNGNWVLTLSSSRICIIDAASPQIRVHRELKVLRRPVSAAILNDGSILAVLSANHHINVYDLAHGSPKRLRSINLDNATHVIALAPEGQILAAAFDGGVEIHSLVPNAAESDRRTVKYDRVESLNFSRDGVMLIGTTRNKNPNTVILTAPYYNDDNQVLPAGDQISHIWTSQIVFPNSSRDCSHATFLPNRMDGDATWTFTYDRVFESFRAVRTDDLRNGTTYFTGPKAPDHSGSWGPRNRLIPSTLPAASQCGEIVAAGFLGKDIWLYGIPEGLEVTTFSRTQSTSSSRPSTSSGANQNPPRSYTRGEAAELMSLPKWQVLVDKHHNVFKQGRNVLEVPGATGVSWVNRTDHHNRRSMRERLIITAPGGIPGDPELEQDGFSFASAAGGRLVILDFDRALENGRSREMTLEVGNTVPEMLEEEEMGMDAEIALARRRTRVDSRPNSTVGNGVESIPSIPPLPPTANAIINATASAFGGVPASPMVNRGQASSPPNTSGEVLSMEEAAEVFDGPYSQNQPRSRNSLYRSATAVAANRERNPRTSVIAQAQIHYRRPDGRGELPHESDADHWVPPPPPYALKADKPLPDHLRQTIMPRSTEPIQRTQNRHEQPQRATTMYESRRSNRVSPLPHRPPFSSPPSPPAIHNPRSPWSVSDGSDQATRPVSPLSSVGSPPPDEPISPPQGRSKSMSSSNSRPATYVGRIAASMRRPSKGRLRSQGSASSPASRPASSANNHSVSSSPRPGQDEASDPGTFGVSAYMEMRMGSSLPPNSVSHRQDELGSVAASMPSAQQLANLNNHSRQAPPPRVPGHLPPGIAISGERIPAPPRGALGAAGSSTSHNNGSPARAVPHGNSFARSTPTLLRPAMRRLDTIESVSSFVSRSRTRSRSRNPHISGTGAVLGPGRSQSVGPALRLDRAPTAGLEPAKKGLFGGKKGRKSRGLSGKNPLSDGTDKGSKCILM